MRLFVYVRYLVALGRLEEKLDRVLQRTESWERKGKIMSAQMDALVAKVAAVHSVVDSAIEAIAGLRQQIADAGTDPVALAAVISDLDGQATALAQAIATPPPAEPPVEPPPPEPPA